MTTQGKRPGGLEVTSPTQRPPSTSGPNKAAAQPATPQDPGELLFSLVLSNERLWTTIDPHQAKSLAAAGFEKRRLIDLGELLQAFLGRGTNPELAKSLVLVYAQTLVSSGVQLRLPAEIQSLPAAERQRLVGLFKKAQGETSTDDDRTQTVAAPQAPPPPRPRTKEAPRPATSPPHAATQTNDQWAAGLQDLAQGKAEKKAAADVAKEVTKPRETTREMKKPDTQAGGERKKDRTGTMKAPPKPSAADRLAGLSPAITPAFLGALAACAVLALANLVVWPGGPQYEPTAASPPREIPCVSLVQVKRHLVCTVDAAAVPKSWTVEDIDEKRATMRTSAVAGGNWGISFLDLDGERWLPEATHPRRRAIPTATPSAEDSDSDEEEAQQQNDDEREERERTERRERRELEEREREAEREAEAAEDREERRDEEAEAAPSRGED